MKLTNELNALSIERLESYCFDNFEDKGLFLLNYLFERFKNDGDENIADIISKLLDTLASHWEGADFFKLHFYEIALFKNPNSLNYLVNILHFGLPPYYGSMNDLFDFQKYKNNLLELDSQNLIFKELEKYSSYDRNGNTT
jgi:hypothetical protein